MIRVTSIIFLWGIIVCTTHQNNAGEKAFSPPSPGGSFVSTAYSKEPEKWDYYNFDQLEERYNLQQEFCLNPEKTDPSNEKRKKKRRLSFEQVKETLKHVFLPLFNEKQHTLQSDPNHPPLSCFKKKLTQFDIIQDIVNLRLFKTNPNQVVATFFASQPFQNKVSFFNQQNYYPVWKTQENPRVSPIVKISNQTITDWFILGDRHGDSVSIDRLLSHLREKNLISNEGILSPEVGIIFTGDYIDRGHDSLGTIHRIITLKKLNPNNMFVLRGNHEEGECGNGLQEELSYFNRKESTNIMKKLHHWYITGFAHLPEMFFLHVPNRSKKTKEYINIIHGGIDSAILEPTIYQNNIKKIKKLLQNPLQKATILRYPYGVKRSTLWGDFSVDENIESVHLGDARKISIGKKDAVLYLAALYKKKAYGVSTIIRAHQQSPAKLFNQTDKIPGIATRFLKNNGQKNSIKGYLINTLNVAPKTAYAFAPQYKNKYQLKYDTILHLKLDWGKGKWSDNRIHFDAKSGIVTPEELLQFN